MITASSPVLWLYAQPPDPGEECPALPHHCEGCGQNILAGDPMAWRPDGDDGSVLCLDCGSKAEDAAEWALKIRVNGMTAAEVLDAKP